jgi:polysaccharide pyruvyl transferase WcaK-like protein
MNANSDTSAGWLVVGHYGGHNGGDEAMLAGLLSAAALQRPGTPSIVRKIDRCCRLVRVRALENGKTVPPKLWPILRALSSARGIVLGGGTHFQDDYTTLRWLRHVRYMARFVLLSGVARLLGRRVVWLGMGFGPIHRRTTALLTALGLRFCDAVAVRDASSAAAIRPLVAKQKLTTAFDLAALLAPFPKSGRPAGGAPLLGISVTSVGKSRGLGEDLDRAFWDRFGRVLGEVVAAGRARVRIIVMRGGAREDDGAVSEQLFAALWRSKPDSVELVPFPHDPLELIRQISECDAFIATRFHSLLLAYLAGCRLLAIEYHKKVRDLAEEIGLPSDACIPVAWDASEERLRTGVDRLLHDEQWGHPSLPVSEAVRRANRNLDLLTEVAGR